MTVDDEFVALDAAAGLEAGEIGAGTGLRKSLAPDDLAGQDLRQVKGLLLGRAAGDQRGSRVIQSDERGVERRGRAGARVFLEPDDLLEDRETATAHLLRPSDSRPAALRLRSLPGQHEVSRGGSILGWRLRRHIGLEPLARLATKSRDRSGHALCTSIVSALLRERSADLMLQHFAGIVLGQRVPNDDLLRDLERGDALEHRGSCAGSATSGPGARFGHDHGTGTLAGARIGQADDRDFGNLRMADQNIFDFLGRDILAVANDDVLGASGHDEIASSTHRARSPVRK